MNDNATIISERVFQDRVLEHVYQRRTGDSANQNVYHLVESFGLDSCILVPRDGRLTPPFLEFKAFGGRNGGVGFGTSRGCGPQVDLLMLPDEALMALDETVRWCFVDSAQPSGTHRYAILSCIEARQTAMGGVRRGKQNNFRLTGVLTNPLSWDMLLDHIDSFLAA